ncbi:hypothetical protein TYRP_012711 [Tyrophagus putrescentiae]|nr:hypothetical protein TYRP_012711 [Tyrophagus putrescentiae]
MAAKCLKRDFLAAIARLTRALRPSSPSPSPSSSSDFSKLPLSLLIVKSRKIVDLQSVQCCEAMSVSTYKGNKFVNRPVPAGEAGEAKKEKFN